MKIALTGHTSGIGKELFDRLSQDNAVLGFSRASGYDIKKNSNVIAREAKTADVFINNAYADGFQLQMFNEIFSLWKNDASKFIINICSLAKYKELYAEGGQTEYSKHKELLSKNSLGASLLSDRECRITCINPGWVDTPGSKSHTDIFKMDVGECADVIISVINYSNKIEIPEISFLRRK